MVQHMLMTAVAGTPLLLLLLLLPLLLTTSGVGGSGVQGTFLVFSDLHYDPFYATDNPNIGVRKCNLTRSAQQPYGTYGCDSPMALIRSAIANAQMEVPNPDFVLLLGDSVRHDTDRLTNFTVDLLTEILQNTTQLLVDAFPNSTHFSSVPIVESIGNNDALLDYFVPVQNDSSTLNIVASAWRTVLSPEDRDSIMKGGFYAKSVASGLTILSLNTILYSMYHVPHEMQIDPLGQFAWLEDQLMSARDRNGKVYIVGHIPPAIDDYNKRAMWLQSYTIRYMQILSRYSDVISAQMYGHFHADQFRVYAPGPLGNFESPILILPSVTPIYDNNPSYRSVTYDRQTKTIIDHRTFYTDLRDIKPTTAPVWRLEYQASSYFNLKDLGQSSMMSLARSMLTDSTVMSKLLDIKNVKFDTPCDAGCQRDLFCAMTSILQDDFTACVSCSGCQVGSTALPCAGCTGSSGSNRTLGVSLVAVIVPVVCVLLFLAFAIYKYCKYRKAKLLQMYMSVNNQDEEAQLDSDPDTYL